MKYIRDMVKQINTESAREIRSICRRNRVDLLILFGSAGTQTAHARSDVDLALQPEPGATVSKLHLIAALEPLFDNRPVDLTVISKNTDPLLLYEIFSNGRLLYECTDGLFEKGRLRAWHLYLDTRSLRQYEKAYNQARIKAFHHDA